MTQSTQLARVLALVEQYGVVSRHDLNKEGLAEEYLAKLAAEGQLSFLAPGVYMGAEADLGEHLELVVVSKRVPHAVFFGITALRFHGLTTQVAHSVELALARGKWTPSLDWPVCDVFHLSDASFSMGVEEHVVEGGNTVRVYSVAKTIADLFKFRSRFGLDVAIEALKEGWAQDRFTLTELAKCAETCRVYRVMRPYMEMLP